MIEGQTVGKNVERPKWSSTTEDLALRAKSVSEKSRSRRKGGRGEAKVGEFHSLALFHEWREPRRESFGVGRNSKSRKTFLRPSVLSNAQLGDEKKVVVMYGGRERPDRFGKGGRASEQRMLDVR